MKRNFGIAFAAGAALAVFASASTASAQEAEMPGYVRQPVRAPRNAFEIGVMPGYTQGFGAIAREAPTVQSITGAGFGASLALGWRATPNWHLGWTGQYQELNADDANLARGTSTRGVLTGVDGTYHFTPFQRVDPWIQAGAGYRMLFVAPEGPNNNVMFHGFELARLTAGIDIRVSEDVAIAPVVGADLNMFLWRNEQGVGNRALEGQRVSTFVFAGLQGRFDLGGTREAQLVEVGRR